MKRYKHDFPSKLKRFDFETLENSAHSIYALSKDLDIIYLNPAWVIFAKENDKRENILKKFQIGTPILKGIKGEEVKKFYSQNYREVLENGSVWNLKYECSSNNVYRNYHQRTYPLGNGEGLLIINSLLVKLPIENAKKTIYEAISKVYTQPTGFITQCCNCRNCQRVEKPEIWDWVPDWVKEMPDNCSHSICPTCFDYYWKHAMHIPNSKPL